MKKDSILIKQEHISLHRRKANVVPFVIYFFQMKDRNKVIS
jgi:hypothetical protein